MKRFKLQENKILFYLSAAFFTLAFLALAVRSLRVMHMEDEPPMPVLNGIVLVQTPHSVQEDPIYQLLEDQLNVKLNIQFVTGNVKTVIDKAYLIGNPPDFIGVDKETAVLLSKRGDLAALDDLLDKMPILYQTFDSSQLSSGVWDKTRYALPRTGAFNGKSIWIRKDWLNHLGMEVPQTAKQLMQLSRAFAINDPDGNKRRDTYGYSSTYCSVFEVFEPFFGAYGLTGGSSILVQDRTLLYEPITEDYRKCLGEIKNFLAGANADPQLLTNSADQALKKALCGQTGILYTDIQTLLHADFFDHSAKIDPDAQWVPISLEQPVLGADILWEQPLYYCITQQAASKPETLNLVCRLFDFLSSEKGIEQIINHTQHMKENSGLFADYLFFTNDELELLYQKYPGYEQKIIQSASNPRRSVYNHLVPATSTFSKDSMDRYISEQLTLFLYGKRDLSEYDLFISELESNYNLKFYLHHAERSLSLYDLINIL